MAKGAASESKCAALHDILFDVLTEQVSERVIEEQEDGSEKELYTATPALLTVALKALKDNEITCQAEDNNKVNALQEQLAKRKRNHGSVVSIRPEMDEADFG